MNEEDRQATELSRRRFLTHTVAGLAAASAVGFGVGASRAIETAASSAGAIPELAPQWKKLDLSEILSRPAAFVSPIVIGDACDCQKPEDEPAALRRINNFLAPVISSDRFVKLLQPGAAAAQG